MKTLVERLRDFGGATDLQAANAIERLQARNAELEAAFAELDAVSEAIGTNAYLDPPDGGSVSLAAQVSRMAKDAARYRWLRHGDNDEIVMRNTRFGDFYLLRADGLDAAIDAAMADQP